MDLINQVKKRITRGSREKFLRLLLRQGNHCNRCHATGVELVEDHIDNDPRNNKLSNKQLICKPCNYLKNPRREELESFAEITETDHLTKNKECEPRWRRFILRVVEKYDEISMNDAINGGAEVCACSPETITRRYLPKITSNYGPLLIIGNRIIRRSRKTDEEN